MVQPPTIQVLSSKKGPRRKIRPISPWGDEGPKLQSNEEGDGRPEKNLGGGFKYFLFSPLLGEMIHFD